MTIEITSFNEKEALNVFVSILVLQSILLGHFGTNQLNFICVKYDYSMEKLK